MTGHRSRACSHYLRFSFPMPLKRYPSFGETLAHNIIIKRQNVPLKHLHDIWNLGAVQKVLLSDCGSIVDENTR